MLSSVNPSAPENLNVLVMLVVLVMGGFGMRRLLMWVRALPMSPDPWGSDVESNLSGPEALPVCHKCITPQPHGQWFCEHCGSAVGEYNNWMPYVYVFSQGEVLRNGVTQRLPRSALIIVGYVLVSLSAYAIFAPVFWYFLFKNLWQIKPDGILADDWEKV